MNAEILKPDGRPRARERFSCGVRTQRSVAGRIGKQPLAFNHQVSGLGAAVNDVILVGYKGGNGETDTGYFYCPYIPLMSSGVVINPVTFQPVVSLMTRYGKTAFTRNETSLGNSADYYGKINVSNFQFA